MATIHCTRKELEAGIEVPLDERTTIVMGPDAALAILLGRAFDADKSFPLPRARDALSELFSFAMSLTGGKSEAKHGLVIGHTDHATDSALREPLSLERANVTAAWLAGKVQPWLDNYGQTLPEERRWGSHEDHLMLSGLEDFDAPPQVASAASPNQANGGARKDPSVLAYQKARGLNPDGIAGPITRKQLITDYFKQTRRALLSAAAAESQQSDDKPVELKLEVDAHGAGSSFSLQKARKALLANSPDASDDAAEPEPAAGESAPSVSDARVELLFSFSAKGLEPAPASASGPEYLEWLALLGEKRIFQAGPAAEHGAKVLLQLFDKTGRTRLARQHYELEGPESFAGETDSSGRIIVHELPAGDYQLKLQLKFLEAPDEVIDDYEAAVLVLETSATLAQVRQIGVVPRCVMARLSGLLFDTNKAFLLPSAMDSLKDLRQIYSENSPGKLLVVGHTDTTSDASINDPLSLERAESMLAYLKNDVDAWLEFYGGKLPATRRWGTVEDIAMASALPDFVASVEAADPVAAFKQKRSITEATTGTVTRTQLITEYMALDSADLDDFPIEGVAHGCGENFPVDATGENLDRAPADRSEDDLDRRVELFFFDEEFGILPPPPGKNSKRGSREYPVWRKRAEAQREADAAAQTRPLDVSLSDTSGAPVEGAFVEALLGERVVASVITDATGQAQLALNTGATVRITGIDESALSAEVSTSADAVFTADELANGISVADDADAFEVTVTLMELDFTLDESLLPETSVSVRLSSADGSVDQSAQLTLDDATGGRNALLTALPTHQQSYTLTVSAEGEDRTVFENLSMVELIAAIEDAQKDLVESEPEADQRLALLDDLDGTSGDQAGDGSGEVVV